MLVGVDGGYKGFLYPLSIHISESKIFPTILWYHDEIQYIALLWSGLDDVCWPNDEKKINWLINWLIKEKDPVIYWITRS